MSLFASGSEVEIAVAAQKQLAERGIASRVVSVPSVELLLAQPADRQKAIIGNAPVRIAIEAAVRWGWDAVIGQDGEFVGMNVIEEIHRKLPNTHLVMHGSSSVPQDLLAIIRQYGGNMKETYGVPVEEIQEAIKHGVRKINIDTDIRLAMR